MLQLQDREASKKLTREIRDIRGKYVRDSRHTGMTAAEEVRVFRRYPY